jgi:transposase
MGAMVAIKYNLILKVFYERLITAGKLKMVVFIVVVCKFLIIFNVIIRDQKLW